MTNNNPTPIQCPFFAWLIYQRPGGIWHCDSRSNDAVIKRFSLATRIKHEAIANLHRLDRIEAENQELVPRTDSASGSRQITIGQGRKLYLDHLARPAQLGGTHPSTRKRVNAILDAFEAFLYSKQITDWRQVSDQTLTEYAKYRTENGYTSKTVCCELSAIKAARKWLCTDGAYSNEAHVDRDERI